MGRILVIFFLVSIGLGVVGAFFAGDQVIRLLWHTLAISLPGRPLPLPPPQPPLVQWGGPVYRLVVLFFGLALPAAVLLQLAADMLIPRRKPAWRVPPPIDLRKQPVAAVLTAYNDEDSIGLAVDEFKALPEVGPVIVIDNNCVDRTAAVAREHGAIVIEEKKQGYGHACMAGLRYALEHTEAPAIVLAEGDMTFYGEDIGKLLPYLPDCDMVVGTRTTRTLTRPDSQMDWFLSWGNLFLALLIRLRFWDWRFLGRVQLTDVGCTFRAIRRDALERIIDQLDDGGNSFSPHMIIEALHRQIWIVEVPVKFRKRVGVSKGAGKNRSKASKIGLEMVVQIAFT
ncbi:MAG: glycosyltransferase family 2 protein [Thermoplasmata archaeon]|nr:glycosyltransferase family 2 protein [Thermoplasmata archaeon]